MFCHLCQAPGLTAEWVRPDAARHATGLGGTLDTLTPHSVSIIGHDPACVRASVRASERASVRVTSEQRRTAMVVCRRYIDENNIRSMVRPLEVFVATATMYVTTDTEDT